MKRALRIIVPVMLALLILVSIAWYSFVYDRAFTRDILLHQARYHSTRGIPELGSWFYDLAYDYSGQDENVAIELANQFKAEGNYTKAEYTLSNAVADGGTVELYIALCKTYVEQDKLLDAVNMLDNVTDPTIKQQLEAMRPAAPAANPAPGFYNQYISVTLDGNGGTIYYTTGTEYPSTEDEPYSEPITLGSGETNIYAITVAENGLVSPLTLLGYTVGGVIEEVTFTDTALEVAVRDQLGVDMDYPLYTDELWTITDLTVPKEASSLDDLTKLPYLETLVIHDLRIDSLKFLSSLTALKELDLTGCRFPSDDLSLISTIPTLERLTLTDCALSTVAGLETAQSLVYLNLSNNTIRNLESLSALMSLKELNLQHNALTGLTALSTLTGLEKLDVSYNSLTSIAPAATCVGLTWLDVGNNELDNLGAVDNLPNLSYLAAAGNSLENVEILANCNALTELHVQSNEIEDISCLSALTGLKILNFSNNEVTALPSWPDGSALYSIDGSYNKLTSISGLSHLQNLAYIYMDYNQITDVTALADCYGLVQLNIYGNEVSDVSDLTARDIIVNYDPTAGN